MIPRLRALAPLWAPSLEFAFDPELQRIRDFAIPLARGVLVDQCSTHRFVAHAAHQLAGAGTACRCQVVASGLVACRLSIVTFG
jgi:hypothetical protein